MAVERHLCVLPFGHPPAQGRPHYFSRPGNYRLECCPPGPADGLTFQNPNHQLFEKLSCGKHSCPPFFSGRGVVGEHSVENLLEFFGLLSYKDRIPQALSMGENGSLWFLSLLINPLLLLDEPLVGQDEEK